jgi:hypothetical protein
MSKAPWWVWASVFACAVASLVSISARHKSESSNRAVGLMMEMSDVESLALAAGVPTSEALGSLKQQGLTGVAITEETLQDLLDRQLVRWDGDELVTNPRESASSETESSPQAVAHQRATDAFLVRGIGADTGSGWRVPLVTVSRDAAMAVMRTPVGIDPASIKTVTDAGLVAVARLFNEPGIRPDIIAASLRSASQAGATAFLIGGDEAIGNRDQIGVTAESMRILGMTYLSPEFVVLGGDAYLRRELADSTIRLHSISQVEGERMSPGEFRERMAKAFRERDVRWLLLRPTSKSSKEPLAQAGETLASLNRAIQKVGGVVKAPRPFDAPAVQPWMAGVIALLALPAVVWTLFAAFGKNWFGLTCAAIAAIASGAAFLSGYREYAALVIATAFPVLGFLTIAPKGHLSSSTHPMLSFGIVSLVSLAGGLCVAGMLVGLDYMLRNDAFAGVKFAMFVPVLVVGWLLLRSLGPIREAMNKPVTWLAATVSLIGLAVIALVALRSGNENPTAVSSLELQLRSLLDNILLVRPRSKEVAFGHPAMVLGLCLAAYRPNLRGWTALLLVAGMVGQTSVVNTLCHLHTPVLLSLQRIGVGLVVGGIIGLLVWLIAKRWTPKMETAD